MSTKTAKKMTAGKLYDIMFSHTEFFNDSVSEMPTKKSRKEKNLNALRWLCYKGTTEYVMFNDETIADSLKGVKMPILKNTDEEIADLIKTRSTSIELVMASPHGDIIDVIVYLIDVMFINYVSETKLVEDLNEKEIVAILEHNTSRINKLKELFANYLLEQQIEAL